MKDLDGVRETGLGGAEVDVRAPSVHRRSAAAEKPQFAGLAKLVSGDVHLRPGGHPWTPRLRPGSVALEDVRHHVACDLRADLRWVVVLARREAEDFKGVRLLSIHPPRGGGSPWL